MGLRVRREPPGDLKAVEVGHHHVEQHEIGLLPADELDGVQAVLGLEHVDP